MGKIVGPPPPIEIHRSLMDGGGLPFPPQDALPRRGTYSHRNIKCKHSAPLSACAVMLWCPYFYVDSGMKERIEKVAFSEKIQILHFISFHFIFHSLFTVTPSAKAVFQGAVKQINK